MTANRASLRDRMSPKSVSGTSAPLFTAATVFATPEEIARRLAICADNCKFNRNGKCSQCGCGGQPITEMVKLKPRRCMAGKW